MHLELPALRLSVLAAVAAVCGLAAARGIQESIVWQCHVEPVSKEPSIASDFAAVRAELADRESVDESAIHFPVCAWVFDTVDARRESDGHVMSVSSTVCWFAADGSIEEARRFPSDKIVWVSQDGSTLVTMRELQEEDRTGGLLNYMSTPTRVVCEGRNGTVYWDRMQTNGMALVSPSGELIAWLPASTTPSVELYTREGTLLISLPGSSGPRAPDFGDVCFSPSGDEVVVFSRENKRVDGQVEGTTTAYRVRHDGDMVWTRELGTTVYSAAVWGSGGIVYLVCCPVGRGRERLPPSILAIDRDGNEVARASVGSKGSRKIYMGIDPAGDRLVVVGSGVSGSGKLSGAFVLGAGDLSVLYRAEPEGSSVFRGAALGPGDKWAALVFRYREPKREIVFYDADVVTRRVAVAEAVDRISSSGDGRFVVAGDLATDLTPLSVLEILEW